MKKISGRAAGSIKLRSRDKPARHSLFHQQEIRIQRIVDEKGNKLTDVFVGRAADDPVHSAHMFAFSILLLFVIR